MVDCPSLPTSLVFKVKRQQPELIRPARPTPKEWKELSDIDDQQGHRFQIPIIQFYKRARSNNQQMLDPAKVIKQAIAKALVPYYPFAGRLREKQDGSRKLVVECNGEGILFIEGDVDVTLIDFGQSLRPPFPCLDELLFDVPGSSSILHSPLILIQVTRLKCGGFILALRLNHTMADAQGVCQFMNAIAEFARGFEHLSVQPVWERHLLCARDPPRVTCDIREYEQVPDPKGTLVVPHDMVHKSFFFGPSEISSLRRFLPLHLKSSSKFEVITACLWRCRTIAIQPDPEEIVRIICILNARSKFNPPLPTGYYGNAFAIPIAISKTNELCNNPLGYALELVKKAKAVVTEEYMKSLADLMVIKGRPHFTVVRTIVVSDNTRAGFADVDYGWGPAAYGGVASGGVGDIPGVLNFYIPLKNYNGEDGIVVPMCLPGPTMDRFVKEFQQLLSDKPNHPIIGSGSTKYLPSSM